MAALGATALAITAASCGTPTPAAETGIPISDESPPEYDQPIPPSSPSPSPPPQSQALDSPDPAPSTQSATAYKPSHTLTYTAADLKEHKRTYTVTLTEWIKGSDSGALEATWRQVGGKDKMPLTTGTYGFASFDRADAAFIFGTVAVVNGSPGFDPEGFSGKDPGLAPRVKVKGALRPWGPVAVVCRQYTSSTPCAVNGQYVNAPLVDPDMAGKDRWGPVPFVLAMGEALVKTPKNPDGNPHFSEGVTLRFGDQELVIKKTW